MLFQFLAI